MKTLNARDRLDLEIMARCYNEANDETGGDLPTITAREFFVEFLDDGGLRRELQLSVWLAPRHRVQVRRMWLACKRTVAELEEDAHEIAETAREVFQGREELMDMLAAVRAGLRSASQRARRQGVKIPIERVGFDWVDVRGDAFPCVKVTVSAWTDNLTPFTGHIYAQTAQEAQEQYEAVVDRYGLAAMRAQTKTLLQADGEIDEFALGLLRQSAADLGQVFSQLSEPEAYQLELAGHKSPLRLSWSKGAVEAEAELSDGVSLRGSHLCFAKRPKWAAKVREGDEVGKYFKAPGLSEKARILLATDYGDRFSLLLFGAVHYFRKGVSEPISPAQAMDMRVAARLASRQARPGTRSSRQSTPYLS